jgi:uncharacterized protein YcbX/catechol 2,3-dioxygenase-like lactoylglutathione lyase family enzyme
LDALESNMPIEIGQVEAIFRYPVKSMRGERLEAAKLGWHGLEGDRRLAFRRIDDGSGFPWLSASKLPQLLLFAPHGSEADLPTHVRTPDGAELPVFGEELAAEVGRRHHAPVQMMHFRNGIFDEASISVITLDTVHEIGRLAGQSPDVRRFRPNIVVRSLRSVPFQEDEWVGGVLSFGGGDEGPEITVTMRDVRCSMVNFDPDSAKPAPEMLKAVVRVHQNTAGIYGTVIRTGELAVGQPILLHAAAGADRRTVSPSVAGPVNVELIAIDHVQLAMPAGGEAKARMFYAGLLGLKEVTKPAALAGRGGAWFTSGGAQVHLGVEQPFQPARKAHPAFRVHGLAELVRQCEAAGYAITKDAPLPGQDRVHIADPFGNRIELIELHAAT